MVGDALGAPFESGAADAFSQKFPVDARGVRTEMCGGGRFDWAPGEFTDRTQMTLLLASSLIECGRLKESDVFDRFRRWVAAAEHFARTGAPAGNGSLTRTTPAAVRFARDGRAATMDVARRISALTHGDSSAGEGCAIYHDLVRVALAGGDPLVAVPAAVAAVAPKHRAKWASVLGPTWQPPETTESNGAGCAALGSAVWALREAESFAEGMRLVLDLGGESSAAAAVVAGGLLGAVHGIAGIPMRWTSAVHGVVPGLGPHSWDLADLHHRARQLNGDHESPPYALDLFHRGLPPVEIVEGLWASDLYGARDSDRDFAVLSLGPTGGRFGHEVQRFAYQIEVDGHSESAVVQTDILDDMQALRADGKRVLVHGSAGQPRTGPVLRDWLIRTEGASATEATRRVAALWHP